jgi:hypothetical protein
MALMVSASASPAIRSASVVIDTALYLLVSAMPAYVFDHPVEDETATFTLNW